jgi:GxxExxY protein
MVEPVYPTPSSAFTQPIPWSPSPETIPTAWALLLEEGPQMNADERRCETINSLTKRVIGCAFEVSNVLGSGFLEKVYQRALMEELTLAGLKARTEVPLRISYKGRYVGDYFADMLVEDRLVIELKCVQEFSTEHIAQCINYLRASGLTVALLMNFQKPKLEWRRLVHKL